MRQIQPTNGHVLLKLVEPESVTAGGLVIPDSAKNKINEGDVINIATGASEEIAIGDRVIYKEFSGMELEFEGEKYLLIPAGDILAKYVETDEI